MQPLSRRTALRGAVAKRVIGRVVGVYQAEDLMLGRAS